MSGRLLGACIATALLAPASTQGQPEDDKRAGDDPPPKEEALQPPPAPTKATTALPDLDALRQEYLKIRDRLFRSRARAAAVASALYSSRLQVTLNYERARFYSVTRATIRLDGANIYDDTAGEIAKNTAPRFSGFIAPGRHVVTIRIEAVGKEDDRFVSTVENTFTVQAPAGHELRIDARAKDAGNIPYSWRKKQRGTYKLRLDVGVAAQKRVQTKGTKSTPASKKPQRKSGATNMTPRSRDRKGEHRARPSRG